MTNPIDNAQFSYDYERYVLQNLQPIPQPHPVSKPFELKAPEKSKKTKKDLNKQKDERK